MTSQTERTYGNQQSLCAGTDVPPLPGRAHRTGRCWKPFFVLCMLLLGAIFLPPQVSHACGPPGMTRTVLNWGNPGIGDFSYFIESYVNHEKYRGRFEHAEGRFFAAAFHEMERQGRRASVSFEVLDIKHNSRFQDQMDFMRTANGAWQFVGADGNVREVFSYMPTWLYAVQTYLRPAAMVGLPLMLVLLAVLRLHRKKQNNVFATGNRIK